MKRKYLIKGSVVLGVFCAGLFVGILLFGEQGASAQKEVLALTSPILAEQKWSSDQKEVWETVEVTHQLDAKEDLEGVFSYGHPDGRAWFVGAALPIDKDAAKELFRSAYEKGEMLFYQLKPLAVVVHGRMAFAHYYWIGAWRDEEGTHMSITRATHVFVKEGDKWLIICGHYSPATVE